MLYALLDGSDKIKEVHLKAGLAVWRYCEDSARYIFGDSIGDPFADEVLRALRNGGGMNRTDIHHFFKRNHSSEKIGATLDALKRMSKARFELRAGGKRGPKVEFWVAEK